MLTSGCFHAGATYTPEAAYATSSDTGASYGQGEELYAEAPAQRAQFSDGEMESRSRQSWNMPAPPSSRTSNGRLSEGELVATNATTPATSTGSATATTVTDASATRSMIIYTASVVLAIYEIDATQRQLVAAAQEAGGFVASLDSTSVVVRIPAARFEAFLATVEGTGRVLGRSIQADDITEQFRDLEIRMQNLMAMRERLEQMLARAANVQEALAVERELERITVELETLRGRLRFLSDRVAFSTVTIQFRALPREELASDTPNAVPVPWLRSLGLGNLLQN